MSGTIITWPSAGALQDGDNILLRRAGAPKPEMQALLSSFDQRYARVRTLTYSNGINISGDNVTATGDDHSNFPVLGVYDRTANLVAETARGHYLLPVSVLPFAQTTDLVAEVTARAAGDATNAAAAAAARAIAIAALPNTVGALASLFASAPTGPAGLGAGQIWTDGSAIWQVADVSAAIRAGGVSYLRNTATNLPPGLMVGNGGVVMVTNGSTQLPFSPAGLPAGAAWNNGGIVCLAANSPLPTSPGAVGTFWNNNNVLCFVVPA